VEVAPPLIDVAGSSPLVSGAGVPNIPKPNIGSALDSVACCGRAAVVGVSSAYATTSLPVPTAT
ncbi:uncharacterized protein METZ01_LOCUS49989, partial [marine metagenome]